MKSFTNNLQYHIQYIIITEVFIYVLYEILWICIKELYLDFFISGITCKKWKIP